MRRNALLLAILIFAYATTPAQARDWPEGFLDFNAYPYLSQTQDDNYLTVNAAAQLHARLSYFSLTNFGEQARGDGARHSTYYTEQNLRWRVSPGAPLDLTVQLNFRDGSNNDRYRFGVRWRLSDTPGLSSAFSRANLTYSINWHAVQVDNEPGRMWQLEHVFMLRAPYLTDRLYLAGFVDHTFNQQLPEQFPERPIVAEAQLGYRLLKGLHAIAEYRINDYRRANVNNLALGVQYKWRW